MILNGEERLRTVRLDQSRRQDSAGASVRDLASAVF